MRVSSKLAVQLMEACDAVGIAREELMSTITAEARASLQAQGGSIEWDTLIELFDRLWLIVGGDVERMRSIGRALVHVPSYVLLQKLAQTVVSVQSLYVAWSRWIAPVALPHVSVELRTVSKSRLRLVGSIPEPYAGSVALLHFCEGGLTELPSLLGLERASIVTSEVTLRTIDIVLELPASRSLFGRARRVLRAAVSSGDALDLLEIQRSELAYGLQAMQRSGDEIQEVFDRLPVLVLIHRDGKILWKNRAVVKTLGYEGCDDLVGRPVFDLVERSARATFRARIKAPVRGLSEIEEARLLTRDGKVLVAEVFPTQLVNFDGRPARMIVGRDATERVRLQQQLLISARMASIGMLAAGVAHEVNNPLAYVLNNIEIAIKVLAPLGDATRQGRTALAVALEGVERIRTIVRDLQLLSRVDGIEVGPVDVLAVVESTLSLARTEIEGQAELVYEHAPVPLARGTVARLGQVLLNLLANALESLPAGRRAENMLRVVVRPSMTNGAVVEITDNGVGIPAEHAERIFDPFFTTKAPGVGAGLGLAISLRLVAEMGGELSFDSAVKQGSTFRVTLPSAEIEDRPPRQESASPLLR